MKRPFEYTIICNKTGKVIAETNIFPSSHLLTEWENTATSH